MTVSVYENRIGPVDTSVSNSENHDSVHVQTEFKNDTFPPDVPFQRRPP